MMSLFPVLAVFMSFAVAGEGGFGTRGGGETIDLGKHPRLRDLVDRSVCVWKRGPSMTEALPEFDSALEKIRRAHPYFASNIEREIEELAFCETEGPLVPIDPTEIELVLPVLSGKRQIAIRLNGTVYLDVALFRRLPPVDRAYLILHEAMHRFIPMNVPQRNLKLRSLIAYLRNETSLERESLNFNLAQDDVEMPWMTAERWAAIEPFFVSPSDSVRLALAREWVERSGRFEIEADGCPYDRRLGLAIWFPEFVSSVMQGSEAEAPLRLSRPDWERLRFYFSRCKGWHQGVDAV